MDWDCGESNIDKAVSGGIDAGRERMVQSRQCEHVPGLAHDENVDTPGTAARPPLCSRHPGQVHPSPQLQAEGKDSPVESHDSTLDGISKDCGPVRTAGLLRF